MYNDVKLWMFLKTQFLTTKVSMAIGYVPFLLNKKIKLPKEPNKFFPDKSIFRWIQKKYFKKIYLLSKLW